jgi:hypothetical protein
LALLQQAGLLDAHRNDALKILDHACSMGLIAPLVHGVTGISQRSPPIEFICGDISLGTIHATEARIEQLGWKGVTSEIIDAHARHNVCDVGFLILTLNSIGQQVLRQHIHARSLQCWICFDAQT